MKQVQKILTVKGELKVKHGTLVGLFINQSVLKQKCKKKELGGLKQMQDD